jgi:hypothetical protein
MEYGAQGIFGWIMPCDGLKRWDGVCHMSHGSKRLAGIRAGEMGWSVAHDGPKRLDGIWHVLYWPEEIGRSMACDA